MINKSEHLGKALAYEDYLPVQCSVQEGVIEPAYFIGLNELNEEILQNVLLMERHHAEQVDDDADMAAAELTHIDFKINLMLDLMIQVFATQLDIPSKSTISLSSSSLKCNSTQSITVGDAIFVDLYLNRRYPRPLTLYGRVSHTEIQQEGVVSLSLDLDHMSPSVQELMERFIFLKHRRKVALDRRDLVNS